MISKYISIIILLISGVFCANARNNLNIWEDTRCRESVKLTPYIAEGENNIGIIVCPGGSYFWLDRNTEGHDVAKWLQERGISAFVLEYRTAGVPAFISHYRAIGGGHKHPHMIQDLQRSIQLVRESAQQYNINPDKLGVMGFSAGGHLVLSSGVHYNTNFLSLLDINPSVSLRPNFVVPIYPVVTFNESYMHKRSRRGLMGDAKIKQNMCDSLSIERHIHSTMPPVFLVNCKDDPIVKYENSVMLDSVLTSHNVPHKYILYNEGGHGFGMSEKKGSDECRNWRYEFIEWLKTIYSDEKRLVETI